MHESRCASLPIKYILLKQSQEEKYTSPAQSVINQRRLRHSLVAEKRRKATISSLQDSLGNTISDPVILHDMAIQYYMDLFSSKGCSADIKDFLLYIYSLVSEADNEMLTATPDLEEIKKAVLAYPRIVLLDWMASREAFSLTAGTSFTPTSMRRWWSFSEAVIFPGHSLLPF